MHLSISARIFGGFLAVLIAFSGVMGYTYWSMNRLRRELQLIDRIYLEATLIVVKLDTSQGNLINLVEDRAAGHGTSAFLRTHVKQFGDYRLADVDRVLNAFQGSETFDPSRRARQFRVKIEEQLHGLKLAFRANESLFTRLFGVALPAEQGRTLGDELLRSERKLTKQIRALRNDLRNEVKNGATQVELEESRAVWAASGLGVVALIITLLVTFGAQLTLRPLKRLVAGTKRIASGDYAHRVAVSAHNELGELAGEFNSMAAAIDEREQRLIRSERMAAAGQIASHITHEIRNPLSAVSLNTELLEEELEASLDGQRLDEARKLCQAMRHEVDRLTDITEEYLRFARLPRPHLQPEDVNEILQNLLSFMAGELRERKVEVIYQLEAQLPQVDADENQLRQAFLNLLRNAGEAMAESGGALTVATRSKQSEVEVKIADTGLGIDGQDLAKVFEPFFSTKESGTGLGLALTQQIIQEHGGSIAVESVPQKGTIFTIRLPACTPPPAARVEGATFGA
jgi:two-component system, NtrC family, sensor kinase